MADIKIQDIELARGKHRLQSTQSKLAYLHANRPFCEALASGIGQELLYDLMITMDHLLEKIIAEKADSAERAEYRVCRKMFNQWSTRLVNYFKIADEFKGRDT